MTTSQQKMLLEVKNVGFRFSSVSGDRLSLVPRLEVSKGEILVILGPNGCGKSTLSKYICKMAQKDTKHGGIIRNSDPLLVWQTKELFPTSVEMNLRLVGGDDREIEELLDEFRLTSLRSKPAASLSGGEQQRLALARAVLAARRNRGLVILDEPDQNLDRDSASLVTDVVRKLCKVDGNTGAIVITHSFQLLRSLGLLGGCKVAVYERIPYPSSSASKSIDIFALHEAVDYNIFLQKPLSPYGAFLLGYDNVFCIQKGIEQTFLNLKDPQELQPNTDYDLCIIPATALTICADIPQDKDYVKVEKVGFSEARFGRDYSRRYKICSDLADLYLVVAALSMDDLPDEGYIYFEDKRVIRESSPKLLPLVVDNVNYLLKNHKRGANDTGLG
jgi:ABC-type Mn2+/Zn2+ transport system ATPase subunit